MEIGQKKPNSKISYSFSLDSSSPLFRVQTVSLYSQEFGVGIFLTGKVRIRKHDIKWSCPQDSLSGSLSLKGVYKKMKEGQGFSIAGDAASHLKACTGIASVTDNLIYLCGEKTSMYILFHDWSTMDAWVTDFLLLLNDFECETVLPKSFSTEYPQFWLYNLAYRRVTQQEIELEIDLQSPNNEFQSFKTRIDLEDESVASKLDSSMGNSNIYIDKIASELIDNFVVGCRREIMVSEMSRDVLSLHSKKIEFEAKKARMLLKKNAEWYSHLEKKHRASLITAQLDAINSSRANDLVLQCFRLVELQKYTLQDHLRKLSIHLIKTDQSDQIIQSVNDRLSELMKQREAVNNKTPITTNKDCTCNCVLF